jgi:transcriptional regulator with XRE-family HTH domain
MERRESSRGRDTTPRRVTRRDVPPPGPRASGARNVSGASGVSGARKLAFAEFVRRALADARTSRAWTGAEVSRRTGVSRQTINRWVRGDWASDPEPERVTAFCTGLGIDPDDAFALLEWSRRERRASPQAPIDPDVAALLQRLGDPRISAAEKFHIRETVRYLAHRPALPHESPPAATAG